MQRSSDVCLPHINRGSLLFPLHRISETPVPGVEGTRIGIVFNGSSLFTGDARSGESEFWRRVIEIDRLEAIIGMPDLRTLAMEILALHREVVR